MRCLITGISGFVGSHLAEFLLTNTDWEIHGYMRWSDSLDNLQGLIWNINQGDIRLHYGDLNDVLSVRRAVADSLPDYVFHLAAQSYPGTSWDHPSETLSTNGFGTLNVLEAVKDIVPEAWVHVCSSAEVYGKVANEEPITEEHPLHAASPYSLSKIVTDHLGRMYAEHGLNVMVTRMFTHTGPRRGDVFAESTFAKQIAMIRYRQMQGPVKVGNLDAKRTIADVRDAVRAYYMLMTVNPMRGAVYNIGGNHTCTIRDILVHLIGHYDIEWQVDPNRLRAVDADLQIPDCSKFKRHTGWEPEIPFEQTMDELMDYWAERVRDGGEFLQR